MKKFDIEALLSKPEKLLAIQIFSGNTFKAENELRIILIRDVNPLLVSQQKLNVLIWNKEVLVERLFVDRNNYIVSEVSLDGKPIKELL